VVRACEYDSVSTEAGSSGHVAVLERWFAAYNTHDVDALCALADPAIEVIPLNGAGTIPPGTTYHGHDGLRTLIMAGFERYPRLRLDYSAPRMSGARITVDLEFVLDDGVSEPAVRTTSCDYRFENGRIRRIRTFERERPPAARRDRSRSAGLSPREREVLTMIAGGQTVAEVANDLVLSPLTIRAHIRNAKDKLQARTTAHAVAIALGENALDL
jgi:DNA-binding CsgD family transcriptional regulator